MNFTWKHNSFECNLSESTMTFHGILDFSAAAAFVKQMQSTLPDYNEMHLEMNLQGLENADSSGIIAIYHVADILKKKNIDVQFTVTDEHLKQKLEIFKPVAKREPAPGPKEGFFEKTGGWAQHIFSKYISTYVVMMSEIFYWSFNDLFRPKARRKGEFFNQSVLIGVNAVPIVAVMSFIIGLVLALQSAAQLRNFGANIFIVDLTVIAMMREMGPLITAILVAGRSGSAIAAEIATMKVTSELDALTTMGLNPIRFVAVPKMYASVATMPFLTIIADVMGIAGGMLVAFVYLDIAPVVFIGRMGESLFNKDIVFGFIKSVVFAGIIVLTGSYYGFQVDKGAEGVGKVTTASVVLSISLVIVADSILGILFY